MEKLILVKLDNDQILKFQAANDTKMKITHALLCGSFGQIFNSEKHCRQRYESWSKMFSGIFSEISESGSHEINDYTKTHNLVIKLFSKRDEGLDIPLPDSLRIPRKKD